MTDNSYASSGNTSDSHITTLELSTTFVKDGTLSFSYRVTAEANFDYFSFEMDGRIIIDKVSIQREFTTETVNVTSGVHIFKWIYTKDFILSDGEDKVFIKDITIAGNRWTDSSCIECPLGTYNNKEGQSQCEFCPPDTFSNITGTVECESCDDDEYAFSGSTKCSKRPICAQSDSFVLYTECSPKEGGGSSRDKLFFWLEPKICNDQHPDAYKLPNNITDTQCAPCNPGFFRNASGICQSCGTNEYSEVDAVECKKCDPGQVGRRDFIWKNFEELPPPSIPAMQKCSGECGSQWRLSTDGSHIDSGIGHGSYVDNSFTLSLTVLGEGVVKFTFQFDCPHGCYLNFIDEIVNNDVKTIVRSSVYSVHTFEDEITNITIPVKQGKHDFSWRFIKYDSSLENRDALIKISEIIVTSVAEGQGGASECSTCLEGTYASATEPFCIPCEPGTANNQTGVTSCQPCPVNTFSDIHGAKVCQPCGDGTLSLEGSTECSSDCIYIQSETTAYEFSNLAKETMYGPYTDSENNKFYFNVCFKFAMDNPCQELEDSPYSISCMVDNRTRAHSAGKILNFYPVEGDIKGTHIVYKNGATCPTGGTRSTNITVLCSPDSGIGVPYPSEPFETEGCVNHFEWKSLYGCPVCLPNDYTFYYTNCENGKQSKVYTWKENPRRCHGGVSLPEPEILDCVSSDLIPCPEGKYLLLDSCQDCLPGTYSLGGTEIFDTWNTIPKNFKTNCQGFVCTKWKPKKDYIEGVANSWLDLTLNFVKDGRFIFEYQGSFGNDVIFNVEIDQDIVFTTKDLALTRKEVSLNITEGIHTIRWHLVAEDITSPSIQKAFIRLFSVKTSGTKLADNVCLPVPEGTYQKEEGKNYYETCPINTKSEGGRSQCQSCGENQYAPRGSSECYNKMPCTVQDYSISFTDCINGQTLRSYTAKEPKVCVGGFEPPLVPEVVECQCPRGYYSNEEGLCVACEEKHYYDTEQGRCILSPPGKAAIRVISFFEDSFQRNYNVTTECTGVCLRSWTLSNQGIDSGVQIGYANSYIEIPVNITGSEGSIFLTYAMDGENEFEIYVDGILTEKRNNFKKKMNTASEHIILPLEIGHHNIVLNYVNLESTGNLRITELGFTDSEEGGPELVACSDGYATSKFGSSHCEICPAGTYSNSSALGGNIECKKCPLLTYSSKEGSTECIPCKSYGYSEPGASYCKTTCSYNTTQGHFDLLPLSDLNITVDHISGVRFEMNLCKGLQSSTCLDAKGNPLSTHICAVLGSSKTGIDFGENPEVEFTSNGLIMTFTEGDECDDYGTKRKSIVNLICELGDHLGVPKYLDTSTNCDAKFEWRTPAACRSCSLDDYELVYGKCISRKRIISYKLNSTDCFSSKYTIPESYVEPCSEISFPIGAIFGIIGAIILLVGIIVFFYIKNRKLAVEYQLLKNAKVDHFDAELDDDNAIALEELNDDL